MKLGNEKLKEIVLSDSKNHFFVKDESVNPSGSIKDLPVFTILNSFKEKGYFAKECTVIEATSGNTGISLAYFQKEFGYKAIIVLPITASQGRKDLIKSYNAELIECEGGMKGCVDKVNELLQKIPNSHVLDQFNQELNVLSHVEITAPQIYKALDKVDYVFAGIGTGGTISGIAIYSKKNNKDTKLIGVEPAESPLISKGEAHPHKIEGIGANFIPNILKRDLLDSVITVSYGEALKFCKILHSNGLFNGATSGANLAAAYKYAIEHSLENKNIVIILPDKGDRYVWSN